MFIVVLHVLQYLGDQLKSVDIFFEYVIFKSYEILHRVMFGYTVKLV